MTRALYRSQWFELLDDFQENDSRHAAQALEGMMKTARSVGVRRLADYSRAALHVARKADRSGMSGSADLAYQAAVRLDDSSFDAAFARAMFLARRGRIREAITAVPAAVTTLMRSSESRLSLFSSLALAVLGAMAAAAVAAGLGLFLMHIRRIWHDSKELAGRLGSGAARPLGLVLIALPLFLTFGPFWLLLYWTVLGFAYSNRRERTVLAVAIAVLGLVPIGIDAVAHENLLRRSPIYVGAVDLAERREDFSVEDGLASIASAYPDQADAWFLLARYAERAGDYTRALEAYSRAIQADPKEYRALVNRGNVRFIEGEYGQAISDYEEAIRRDPRAAEAFYNLSLARSEIYDFKGQEAARAQALEISRRDVDTWSSHPPLTRVVAAAYPVGEARERARIVRERIGGEHAAKSGSPLVELALSPWCLAPWGALVVALVFGAIRSRLGTATECARCGKAFCARCKGYGGSSQFCGRCARVSARREAIDGEERERDLIATRLRATRRRFLLRLGSAIVPGLNRFLSGRPWGALAVLFLFFLLLVLALGGPFLFDLTPLAPARSSLPARIAAAIGAGTLWLVGVLGVWRQTR